MQLCTLARVGLISQQRERVRRQVAMRLEAQVKEERKAQWMEEGAMDSLPPGTCLAKEKLMIARFKELCLLTFWKKISVFK